jgi:molybdopterin-guanine dinucleotide biosynthesis protein MobB
MRSREPWVFHPFEIALVGYQNSGKTTLLEGLTRRFASEGLQIGYLKHDAHHFQMDHPGKDTYRMSEAGASSVYISDHHSQAVLHQAPKDPRHCLAYLEADVLLVEGHKSLPIPRIAVLDPAWALAEDPAILAAPPLAWVYPDGPPSFAQPAFHRDDLEGIAAFITKYWSERVPPVRGLVLAGGQSRRMGQEKALLTLEGQTAVRRAFALLLPRCSEVFVSCREDQACRREDLPQIHDVLLDHGPSGGILSAFHRFPDCAWLVVACDLPYLDGATLDALLGARAPMRYATAFQGHKNLPEPLCTLYEPKARARCWEFLSLGHTCPRKVLIHSRINCLPPLDGKALANVNTPSEHQEAVNDLSPGR